MGITSACCSLHIPCRMVSSERRLHIHTHRFLLSTARSTSATERFHVAQRGAVSGTMTLSCPAEGTQTQRRVWEHGSGKWCDENINLHDTVGTSKSIIAGELSQKPLMRTREMERLGGKEGEQLARDERGNGAQQPKRRGSCS